jgi:hypothetical protein
VAVARDHPEHGEAERGGHDEWSERPISGFGLNRKIGEEGKRQKDWWLKDRPEKTVR